MRSIATIIFIFVFMCFAIRSNFAAMLMYWWFSIFRPQNFMYWDISSIRIPLLAAIIFFVPAILKRNFPTFDNYFVICIIIWVVLTALADIVAGCDNANFHLNAAYIYTLMLTMFLTLPLLNTRDRILGMCFTVSVSLCILNGKSGLYAAYKGISLYDANVGSGSFTGSNAAALGTAIATFFLIFALQILSNKEAVAKMHRIMHIKIFRWGLLWSLWIILIGSIYFVIATQSRGSGLGLLGGAAVWLLLHPRRVITITMGVILASSLLAFVSIPQGYSDRIASAFVESEDRDNSAASRPHFWNTAGRMANDHPVGVGVGCYSVYYNVYDETLGLYGRWRSVHSSHFGVLAELGYIGFLLWMFLLLKTYFKLWKIRQVSQSSRKTSVNARFFFNLSNAMIAAQTTFILGGAFYEMTYNYYIWLIFALAVASEALYLVEDTEESTPEAQVAATS